MFSFKETEVFIPLKTNKLEVSECCDCFDAASAADNTVYLLYHVENVVSQPVYVKSGSSCLPMCVYVCKHVCTCVCVS